MPACAGMFGVNISGDIFERSAELSANRQA
jgi:hypothetical protein